MGIKADGIRWGTRWFGGDLMEWNEKLRIQNFKNSCLFIPLGILRIAIRAKIRPRAAEKGSSRSASRSARRRILSPDHSAIDGRALRIDAGRLTFWNDQQGMLSDLLRTMDAIAVQDQIDLPSGWDLALV
jgi:hypothetical protein